MIFIALQRPLIIVSITLNGALGSGDGHSNAHVSTNVRRNPVGQRLPLVTVAGLMLDRQCPDVGENHQERGGSGKCDD